jgi:hypothetical protein
LVSSFEQIEKQKARVDLPLLVAKEGGHAWKSHNKVLKQIKEDN